MCGTTPRLTEDRGIPPYLQLSDVSVVRAKGNSSVCSLKQDAHSNSTLLRTAKETNMKPTNIFKKPVTIAETLKAAGNVGATVVSIAGTTITLTAEVVELVAKGTSTGLAQAHNWLDEVNEQLEADAQKAQEFAVKRQREAELRTEMKLKELDINSFQNTVSFIQRRIELNLPYEGFIQKIVQIYQMDKVNTESLEMLHELISIYSAEGIDVTYLTNLYQNIHQQLQQQLP